MFLEINGSVDHGCEKEVIILGNALSLRKFFFSDREGKWGKIPLKA